VYLGGVSLVPPTLRWSRPVFITLLLVSGSFAHADTKPVALPGYRLVEIKNNGRTGYIQVKDATNPYQNVSSSDQFSFNSTSSYAHKAYDMGTTPAAQGSDSYQKNLQSAFVTKSYFPSGANSANKSMPGLNSSFPVSSAAGLDRTATGFDKHFSTSTADADQNKTSGFAAKSSDYQDRTATLGGHEIKTFAYTPASKTYDGPEAALIKRDLTRTDQSLSNLQSLPNRPLTIDEVRALINHGTEPNLNDKPASPTKALNDPDYQPDPAPAPLRASPQDSPKDDPDAVPSPGTMGTARITPPENSEPLPQ
jgi:hypothetical protein